MITSCVKLKVMFFVVRCHEIRKRKKLSGYKCFGGTYYLNLQISVSNQEYG